MAKLETVSVALRQSSKRSVDLFVDLTQAEKAFRCARAGCSAEPWDQPFPESRDRHADSRPLTPAGTSSLAASSAWVGEEIAWLTYTDWPHARVQPWR